VSTSTARLEQASWTLLVIGIVAYVVLSASTLFVLGMPYNARAGPFISKIHPGTYAVGLSWLLALLSRGNPLRALGGHLRRNRLMAAYLACMMGVFAWAVFRHGPAGLAFVIDTLIMPGIAGLALALQSRERQRKMLSIVVALVLVNSAIAVVEALTAHRLVPLAPDRVDFIEEPGFRASALLGNPLGSAFITVSLMPAITFMHWRLHWKLLAEALCTLAVLAFGSRSALAGLIVYGAFRLLPVVWRVLKGGYNYTQIVGGLVAAAVAATVLAGLVAVSGLGERIFNSLTWDNSASVRLRIWDILDYVRPEGLWFGLSIPDIDKLSLRAGIDPNYEAIENYWLYMLLLLGFVGFILFVAGVGVLVWRMCLVPSWPLRVGTLVFLVISSGANTLSSKSICLVLLVMVAESAAQYRRTPPLARLASASRHDPAWRRRSGA
jgi:O-antigen ligase